jgi:hypothetical protein
MIYAVGAGWIVAGEFTRYQAHLSDTHQLVAQLVIVAAVGYLTSLALQRWSWSKTSARPGIAWLAISTVLDVGLVGLTVWTWLRGPNSRLLLAGGSELLASLTVVLGLQIAWYAWEGTRLRSHQTIGTQPTRTPVLAWLRGAMQLATAMLMIVSWCYLEQLGLPHEV